MLKSQEITRDWVDIWYRAGARALVRKPVHFQSYTVYTLLMSGRSLIRNISVDNLEVFVVQNCKHA